MFKQIGQEFRHGGAVGVGALTASALFYGYLATTLSNLVQGRIQDMTSDDPKIQFNNFLDAAAKGGLGGMYGSFIIDQIRFGDSPASMGTGASLQFIDDQVQQLWRSGDLLLEGDTDKAAAGLVKQVRKLLPFASMPQFEMLVNYTMYYPLMDMLDSDQLRRIEKNFNKQTGGKYFIPPDEDVFR
jgi:hypothetical protein